MRISVFSLAVILISAVVSAGELLDPVPILVGDKPLDVELMGHAAPFVADFDSDGVRDLLVGEYYKGRLRIYRNVGSNREPQFKDFTLFQNGDRSGCIHSSCCMGFAPQVIDLDGDGRRDVLSGNWLHEIILFRGFADGTFAAGEPINDRSDRPLKIGYGVTAFAVDWDADGDLDLLAGTVEYADGNVYLIRNEGTLRKPIFGKPERLLASDTPILATDGGAAPVAADWDHDGKLDLILGCGDGSVRWYRNGGTSQSPALSNYDLLVEPSPKDGARGVRSKPCVIDWNEDGYLDLLVGVVGQQFEKQLSAEEEAWRQEAKDQQSVFFKEWARVFARYRELMAATSKVSEGDRVRHDQQLAAAREEMNRLNTVRRRFFENEDALKPGSQFHGNVWLFLNVGSSNED
jgi:hypothetical protein